MVRSQEHKDGWGIAYYQRGELQVVKGLLRASEDVNFRILGKCVATNTLIAHLRRATQGAVSLVNCHPFHYKNWVMAHNGDMPDFLRLRAELVQGIDENFLHGILGTTDSEVYFALLLHELKKQDLLDAPEPPLARCAEALRNVVDRIEFVYRRHDVNAKMSLNVVLSNGRFLLGLRKGRELSYCSDASEENGHRVSHFVLCSEPLFSEATWHEFDEGQIVAIDSDGKLYREL